MAKRKHAAALFEVIHHDKRFVNRHATWSWPKFRLWSERKAREVDDVPGAPRAAAGGGPKAGASAAVPAAAAAPRPTSTKPRPGASASMEATGGSHFSGARRPSTLTVTAARRQAGLQYVVVQSYPPEEEKYAK